MVWRSGDRATLQAMRRSFSKVALTQSGGSRCPTCWAAAGSVHFCQGRKSHRMSFMLP